jgi:hypothetical protein
MGKDPYPRDPADLDSRDSGDGPPRDSHEEAVDRALGSEASDDTMPPTRGRRREAMIAGLVVIAVIVVFLVWFIATNTERSEPGSLLGDQVPHPSADSLG